MWPRSVRATPAERTRVLPGDERIPQAIDTLTHGVTIRRAPRDVWPWLVQMGAGSRAGWYSYDRLDNGRQASAMRIMPELLGCAYPTLLLIGDHEVISDPVQALARARLLMPDLEGELVPQCRHDMCVSQYQIVDARVLEFLKEPRTDDRAAITERFVAQAASA